MCIRALWLLCAAFIVSVVGPVALLLGKVNGSDSADLYLLLGHTARAAPLAQITHIGAVEVGPQQATFARLIQASPHVRTLLVAEGYVLLPAGEFAGICGFETTPSRPLSRNT